MSYKGYKKPFVNAQDSDDTKYAPSIDQKNVVNPRLYASASGFGVKNPITSNVGGTKTVGFSYEVLEALPAWYVRNTAATGRTFTTFKDSEGTALGSVTAKTKVSGGGYTLTRSGSTIVPDAGDYVSVGTSGSVLEGYVLPGATATSVTVQPTSGDWANVNPTGSVLRGVGTLGTAADVQNQQALGISVNGETNVLDKKNLNF